MGNAQVLLLAAGRGLRLGSLTEHKPKTMLPILGRPLFSWLLETIRAADLDEPLIVTGYEAQAFESYQLRTIHNSNWQTTNMVASLICARDYLRSFPTIISYADIMYASDDLKRLVMTDAPISISYDPNWLQLWARRFEDPLDDAEAFVLDSHGSVNQIGGRPKRIEDVQGQYMGLVRVTPEGWASLEAIIGTFGSRDVARFDMTSLLRIGISHFGLKVRAVPISSVWCEIDLPSDIPIAEDVMLKLLAGQNWHETS